MSNLSPTPGTPQTATKATVAAVIAFIGSFIVALVAATADRTDLDTMTGTQWLLVVLGALGTAVTAGGLTYQAKNRAL